MTKTWVVVVSVGLSVLALVAQGQSEAPQAFIARAMNATTTKRIVVRDVQMRLVYFCWLIGYL